MPKDISRLHYITQDVAGKSHAALVEEACKEGVDWVQIRLKNKSEEDWLTIAKKVQNICKKYKAKFIINDNVLLAKKLMADGVHLGKSDMPVDEARKILGENFIIGGTANTSEDVKRLNESGADYIGVGPFRFTVTKENLSPILGIEGIKKACANSRIPVIAIGGIKPEDISTLMETGVHGIAVSSAINHANDKKDAKNKLKKWKSL